MKADLKRLHYAPNPTNTDPGTLFAQACIPRAFFSAGSMGVVNGNGMFIRHFGTHSRMPSDPTIETNDLSLYDIASVTKSIVALVVLWAVTHRYLRLDDLVKKYLPSIKVAHGSEPTIKDLLTYAACFHLQHWNKPYTGMSPEEMRDGLMSADVLVGNMTHYANYPPVVLGIILEKVTGQSLPELCQEVLFEPLGIFPTFKPPMKIEHVVATRVHCGATAPGIVHDEFTFQSGLFGAAGLYATCEDLLRIGRLILGHGFDGSKQLISRSLIDAMCTNQFDHGPKFGLGWGLWDQFATGYDPSEGAVIEAGLQGFSKGAIMKNGYTGCQLAIFPKINTATVILTNRVHPADQTSHLWINQFRYSCVMTLLTGVMPAGTSGLWQ